MQDVIDRALLAGTGAEADPSRGADPPAAAGRRALRGWVLYDLANVLFSVNIVSLYFPLWVVKDAGGRDGDYGLANSAAMAIVFLLAPFLGALSDRVPRRLPYLAATTVVCCALVAGLGHGGLRVSLVLFVLAVAVFNGGLIFYDALLPIVSTPENRGRVSGYGVAAGFGGAFLGIVAGIGILALLPGGKPTVFKVTALLFLLGSLPCFLWLREPPRDLAPRPPRETLRAAAHGLRGTAGRARSVPGLPRFLVARVFYTDAANTLFAFMGVYAAKEIGFSDLRVQLVLLGGILAGPAGALLCGRAADRIGPKRVLVRLLALWALTFVVAAAVPLLGLPPLLFWLVAPFAGFAIGGTGTVDRALLLRLAPPERVGECLGLFAMVNRFSAILGPLLWTAIVDWLRLGRPAAVLSLLLMTALSAAIFRPLREPLNPSIEIPNVE